MNKIIKFLKNILNSLENVDLTIKQNDSEVNINISKSESEENSKVGFKMNSGNIESKINFDTNGEKISNIKWGLGERKPKDESTDEDIKTSEN